MSIGQYIADATLRIAGINLTPAVTDTINKTLDTTLSPNNITTLAAEPAADLSFWAKWVGAPIATVTLLLAAKMGLTGKKETKPGQFETLEIKDEALKAKFNKEHINIINQFNADVFKQFATNLGQNLDFVAKMKTMQPESILTGLYIFAYTFGQVFEQGKQAIDDYEKLKKATQEKAKAQAQDASPKSSPTVTPAFDAIKQGPADDKKDTKDAAPRVEDKKGAAAARK